MCVFLNFANVVSHELYMCSIKSRPSARYNHIIYFVSVIGQPRLDEIVFSYAIVKNYILICSRL